VRAIFLSYRRDDAEGEAGRLFDFLTAEFGADKVFMDVTGIEPGRDFRKVIDQNVTSCGVLLAMIGKGWLDAKDDAGRPRLDDPMDFVRLETASALKRDIPVIPVLVHGGRMPRPEQLPEDLKDLAYRNAVELTHPRWDSDVQLLIKVLRPYVDKELEQAGDAEAKRTLEKPLGKSATPASKQPRADSATLPASTQPTKRFWRRVVLAGVAATAIAAAGIFLRSCNSPKEQTSTNRSLASASPTAGSQTQGNPANIAPSTSSNSTNATPSALAKARPSTADSGRRPDGVRETKSDPEIKRVFITGESYYKAGQYEQALPLLRKAAESGDGGAAAYLGLICEKGLGGLPKDDAQAVSWFRKAADAGNARGMSGLGFMYEKGLGGLPKDDAQAVSWYRKAADADDAWGMNNLGGMYAGGRGGLPKDETQAVSWYRKGADGGHARSMTNLGSMYESGRGGLPKDDAQAVSWYRKGADAGDARGMSGLGFMYEKGRGGLPKDEAQAVSWYRKAADADDAWGMNNLGAMYASGRGGLPKDDVQALKWYRKAADAGYAHGISNLGNMYEKGRGGLPKDDVQAVSWYRKGADAGDAWAMNKLGAMYEIGRGGLRKDKAQAVNWYSKAAALGNTDAEQALKRLGH
jgi:TPR repeat protein